MVNTLVLFDVAHKRDRQRLDKLLRGHGFLWLFPNVRWSSKSPASYPRLTRAIRAALKGSNYRVVLIEIPQSRRRAARWIISERGKDS